MAQYFAGINRSLSVFYLHGFKKDARFSKLKSVPDLLSDNWEGKLTKNIEFTCFSNRGPFMENPVYMKRAHT